jgi:hypothetical protein
VAVIDRPVDGVSDLANLKTGRIEEWTATREKHEGHHRRHRHPAV